MAFRMKDAQCHPPIPRGLDRAGFIMSAACAVHCALMPFVAGLLPLIGFGFLAGRHAEVVLLLAAAAIALISLIGGCRHHGRFGPLAMVGVGFTAILVGRIFLTDAAETLLVVPGALTIALAHLANWRLCCAAKALNHDDRPR
jgi:hypothetical protein